MKPNTRAFCLTQKPRFSSQLLCRKADDEFSYFNSTSLSFSLSLPCAVRPCFKQDIPAVLCFSSYSMANLYNNTTNNYYTPQEPDEISLFLHQILLRSSSSSSHHQSLLPTSDHVAAEQLPREMVGGQISAAELPSGLNSCSTCSFAAAANVSPSSVGNLDNEMDDCDYESEVGTVLWISVLWMSKFFLTPTTFLHGWDDLLFSFGFSLYLHAYLIGLCVWHTITMILGVGGCWSTAVGDGSEVGAAKVHL